MADKGSNKTNREVYLTLVKFFHLITAIQFCFAVFYDFSYVHVPGKALRSNKSPYGGKFKYLTFLNAVSLQKQDATCDRNNTFTVELLQNSILDKKLKELFKSIKFLKSAKTSDAKQRNAALAKQS